MPPVDDVAICVRSWDWSETSQTLSLLTRAGGLVRCLAKGSRRQTPSAAFSGGVEVLTLGDVQLHLKPQSELALLTRWDLAEVFPFLRRNLAAYYAALYAAELVQALCAEGDPHPAIFDALLEALRALAARQAPLDVLAVVQWAALTDAGYAPELDTLVTTGAPLPATAGLTFDPVRGGFVGPATTGGREGQAGPDWRVRTTTVEYLRTLREGSRSNGLAAGAAGERAARFLAAYVRHVVQREMRTLPLVFPDLA